MLSFYKGMITQGPAVGCSFEFLLLGFVLFCGHSEMRERNCFWGLASTYNKNLVIHQLLVPKEISLESHWTAKQWSRLSSFIASHIWMRNMIFIVSVYMLLDWVKFRKQVNELLSEYTLILEKANLIRSLYSRRVIGQKHIGPSWNWELQVFKA